MLIVTAPTTPVVLPVVNPVPAPIPPILMVEAFTDKERFPETLIEEIAGADTWIDPLEKPPVTPPWKLYNCEDSATVVVLPLVVLPVAKSPAVEAPPPAPTEIASPALFKVIEAFVAQTGNPNNKDGGKSDEPNLPPEFNFRLGADIPRTVVARPQGETEGFIGASPYASVDETRMAMSPDHRVTGWGAFCPGVVGMGRDAAPDSANSEIFLMREATRRLDRDYAVVGKVVAGLEVVRSLTVGEPPVHPDKMVRVSVMSDLPDNERPKVRVLNTLSPQFTALADRIRALRGADFSICDIEVPTRAY